MDGVNDSQAKMWVFGIGCGKYNCLFAVFGVGVSGVFFDPWCRNSLDDTLSDFDRGFNCPVVARTERTYILDTVGLFFFRIEFPDVGWEGGDFEICWFGWDQG